MSVVWNGNNFQMSIWHFTLSTGVKSPGGLALSFPFFPSSSSPSSFPLHHFSLRDMLNPRASPRSARSWVINGSKCTQKRASLFSAYAWSVNVFNYFEAGFCMCVCVCVRERVCVAIKAAAGKPSINVFSLSMTIAPIYLIGTIEEWEEVQLHWMLKDIQEKADDVPLPPLQSAVMPAAHIHRDTFVSDNSLTCTPFLEAITMALGSD